MILIIGYMLIAFELLLREESIEYYSTLENIVMKKERIFTVGSRSAV